MTNNGVDGSAVGHTPDSAGTALMCSTWEAGLSDVMIDAGDIAIDQLLDSGVLKDVPVVGWLARAASVVGVVRDGLLLKKILRFLEGSATSTPEEREVFRAKMEGDPSETRRVGEQLLLYLERHEHFDKSFYLGMVFAAFMSNRIDRRAFDHLAAAVDRLDVQHLSVFPELYASLSTISEDIGQALLVAGLVGVYFTLHDIRVVDGPQPAGSGMFNYRENELGQQLVHILDDPTA